MPYTLEYLFWTAVLTVLLNILSVWQFFKVRFMQSVVHSMACLFMFCFFVFTVFKWCVLYSIYFVFFNFNLCATVGPYWPIKIHVSNTNKLTEFSAFSMYKTLNLNKSFHVNLWEQQLCGAFNTDFSRNRLTLRTRSGNSLTLKMDGRP